MMGFKPYTADGIYEEPAVEIWQDGNIVLSRGLLTEIDGPAQNRSQWWSSKAQKIQFLVDSEEEELAIGFKSYEKASLTTVECEDGTRSVCLPDLMVDFPWIKTGIYKVKRSRGVQWDLKFSQGLADAKRAAPLLLGDGSDEQ